MLTALIHTWSSLPSWNGMQIEQRDQDNVRKHQQQADRGKANERQM